MNMKKRLELIQLLSEELHETALRYEKAASKKECPPYAGCDVAMFDCREALKRRITVLREELLELSRTL